MKLNKFVTIVHIFFILGYSILSILHFNVNEKLSKTAYDKAETALVIFAGTADLFLSVQLWLIMDKDKEMVVLMDGDRSYPVLDVI